MSGLLLRLAGPMQSWGEHSAFAERDTQRFPTRSGLIGMFAAAEGLSRGAPLTRFDPLRLTIRIDRPGVLISDFHTVGGGRPARATVPTAEGGRRSPQTATIVTRRHYLCDAVFVVAVEGPDDTIDAIARNLRSPRWPPYLGRRSCPPDQPLLLRTGLADPITHLRQHVPVARWEPFRANGESASSDTIDTESEVDFFAAVDNINPDEPTLDFVFETAHDEATVVTRLTDIPETFDRLEPRYRTRAVSIVPQAVPAALWKGTGHSYREALFSYMEVQ
ncbi:type I-E CRISPR-associated protein Cas5/CasD [Actinomadura kijaniata]|uniref:type I-E CRISPR-associated protein Cas5/CasD n=1 Tax=Actinomadura kijaniata TaxID=46161 RepID=UPI003F1967F1